MKPHDQEPVLACHAAGAADHAALARTLRSCEGRRVFGAGSVDMLLLVAVGHPELRWTFVLHVRTDDDVDGLAQVAAFHRGSPVVAVMAEESAGREEDVLRAGALATVPARWLREPGGELLLRAAVQRAEAEAAEATPEPRCEELEARLWRRVRAQLDRETPRPCSRRPADWREAATRLAYGV